jgi:hypothetical protein
MRHSWPGAVPHFNWSSAALSTCGSGSCKSPGCTMVLFEALLRAPKGGRRYRYFVSRGLVRKSAKVGQRGWRISAPELERAVLNIAHSILGDHAAIITAFQESGSGPDNVDNVEQILGMASDWRQRLLSKTEAGAAISELIKRVQLRGQGIRVTVKLPPSPSGSDVVRCSPLSLSHFVPMRMRRRGVEMRLILNREFDEPRKVDPALLKAIARAPYWFEEVASGRVRSLVEITRREGLRKRYATRLTKLAFVAPVVAEAVAEGRPTTGINLQMLMDGRLTLPLCWDEQKQMFTLLEKSSFAIAFVDQHRDNAPESAPSAIFSEFAESPGRSGALSYPEIQPRSIPKSHSVNLKNSFATSQMLP